MTRKGPHSRHARACGGDPSCGEKPGCEMTPDELKASANDRTRMRLQPKGESNGQGGKLSQYAKENVLVCARKMDATDEAMKIIDYTEQITQHYESFWQRVARSHFPADGPWHEISHSFRVLEFAPDDNRTFWTYATIGMSQPQDVLKVELHLHSNDQDPSLCNLLAAVAHYHRTGKALGLDHTVNFGIQWKPQSLCRYGLVSLPYLDGPSLERMPYGHGDTVNCLWLIPITHEELKFSKEYGVDGLEERFDETQFDYLDPRRASVV